MTIQSGMGKLDRNTFYHPHDTQSQRITDTEINPLTQLAQASAVDSLLDGFLPGKVVAAEGFPPPNVVRGQEINTPEQLAQMGIVKVAAYAHPQTDLARISRWLNFDNSPQDIARVISGATQSPVVIVETDNTFNTLAGDLGVGTVGAPANTLPHKQLDIYTGSSSEEAVRTALSANTDYVDKSLLS
jgi:hypothetical protein